MSTGRKGRWQKFGTNEESNSSSSDDESYSQQKNQNVRAGPALPPQFSANQKEEDLSSNAPDQPALPPHIRSQIKTDPLDKDNLLEKPVIGPILPQHLLTQTKPVSEIGVGLPRDTCAINSEDISEEAGPALPSHLRHLQLPSSSGYSAAPIEHEVAGPALPPGFRPEERILGPQLPPGFVQNIDSDSSEEGGSFGPDPRLMLSGEISMQDNVDQRAERAKKKMLGLEDKKVERESWMLDLPPERAVNLGLGPRQFRAKLAPEMGDRSVWTDTPTDTARKEGLPPKLDEKAMIKKQLIDERDREMERAARKAEKKMKRKESLLDSHTKKLKKMAKKEEKKGEPAERKRFSREDDMQVHRFDEAQKKAIFKKAQFLNDRFSRGESKFL